ncbi:MAG TPA: EscU/YscU/HrcU family type III secretion system export apparatus switch protein [Candidatus Acidoferrales bacterium]|nr:EscU/YscU/HrcU family type III secretion system export apparatus switch protein [Candidatus Acidoferrales bacterium]
MPSENRSEKATARRREKAREQGQVVRSRDLVMALTLLTVTMMLAWQPQVWIGRWRDLFGRLLATSYAGELGPGTSIFTWTALTVAQWIAPVLLLALGVAVFSSAAQGGLIFAPQAFKPNWGRLNPASNVRRLFSFAGLSRALRSLVPSAAILYLFVSILERDLPKITHLARFGPRAVLSQLGSLLFELAWKCGVIMLAWSGADFLFQRWSYERSLMMTKQEVRQESKDMEGSPLIRGRIKRMRRAFHRKLLAKEVARATAVVTNPTHYAVALEYRPETMAAPVVVAKGRNLLAERIKQIARWHEIPIIENPPLAQALYKATEVGQAIPPKLYVAVAEILAFLYRAKSRLQASQPRTGA